MRAGSSSCSPGSTLTFVCRVAAGWTPLHWAVQNNDIPIASYLLNHRASPLLASRKGLTARDLVKPGAEGSAMREVLTSAWEAAVERERVARRADEGVEENGKGKGGDGNTGAEMARSESRLSLAASEALSVSWEEREREKAEEQEREMEGRRRVQLAMESAQNLELDMAMLGVEDGRRIVSLLSVVVQLTCADR